MRKTRSDYSFLRRAIAEHNNLTGAEIDALIEQLKGVYHA